MSMRMTFAERNNVPVLVLLGWEDIWTRRDGAVLMVLRNPPPVTDLILEAKKHLQIEDQHHAH